MIDSRTPRPAGAPGVRNPITQESEKVAKTTGSGNPNQLPVLVPKMHQKITPSTRKNTK